MEPITPVEKINQLKKRQSNGTTQMHTMQPLNEIGRQTIFDSMFENECNKLNKKSESNVDKDEKECDESYDKICMDCQIIKIVGSCSRCGLYQYGHNYIISVKDKV